MCVPNVASKFGFCGNSVTQFGSPRTYPQYTSRTGSTQSVGISPFTLVGLCINSAQADAALGTVQTEYCLWRSVDISRRNLEC